MKILIIRFSSIGDIVLTTPIIRCIKNQINNVQVHYLTKKQYAIILENNPYIDKLYTIEKSSSEISSSLKKENYDFIIDLHHNLRSAEIKLMLKSKNQTFSKLNIEKWLMVNFKINKLPNKHIVDRYFEAIQPIDVINDGNGLDYFIPQKDKINTSALPSAFQNDYIAFIMGATYATKQLPKEKILSILSKLKHPIILLGGKEETEKGDWLISETGNTVFNACGKYNLNQSASLIEQAKKVITHDTGLMHIAAAFKKEIVSVWGNTIPEFGMYPYYGKSQVLNFKAQVSNLSCRPCSKLGYAKCPKGHFKCMWNINEEEIIRFIL